MVMAMTRVRNGLKDGLRVRVMSRARVRDTRKLISSGSSY